MLDGGAPTHAALHAPGGPLLALKVNCRVAQSAWRVATVAEMMARQIRMCVGGGGAETLGMLAKLCDLEGLERKMRWESKSPNDPVSPDHLPAMPSSAQVYSTCYRALLASIDDKDACAPHIVYRRRSS